MESDLLFLQEVLRVNDRVINVTSFGPCVDLSWKSEWFLFCVDG